MLAPKRKDEERGENLVKKKKEGISSRRLGTTSKKKETGGRIWGREEGVLSRRCSRKRREGKRRRSLPSLREGKKGGGRGNPSLLDGEVLKRKKKKGRRDVLHLLPRKKRGKKDTSFILAEWGTPLPPLREGDSSEKKAKGGERKGIFDCKKGKRSRSELDLRRGEKGRKERKRRGKGGRSSSSSRKGKKGEGGDR